MPKILSQVPDA